MKEDYSHFYTEPSVLNSLLNIHRTRLMLFTLIKYNLNCRASFLTTRKNNVINIILAHYSSVDIATGYGLDGRGWIPRRCQIFLLFTPSGQALGPTQPPIQWVPRTLPQW
jgi:hypothetical protein